MTLQHWKDHKIDSNSNKNFLTDVALAYKIIN